MKKIFAAVSLLLLLSLSFPVAAPAEERPEPSGSNILLDVVVTRPLGLVSMAVGATVFVISLPFALPTGSTGLAARKLVVEPFKFTFARPLGDVRGYSYDNMTSY